MMKLSIKTLLITATLCSPLAVANSPAAHNDYLKGTAYLNQENYQEAIVWLTKAANSGSVDAQNRLGGMYAKGVGTDVNTTYAIELFTKAARKKDTTAYFNLGKIYQESHQYHLAKKWYEMAKENQNVNATNNLADLYLNGKGTVQNTHQAERLYIEAAEMGSATAMRNLGFLYSQDAHIKQDMARAYFWFNLAAAHAYPNAETYRDNVSKTLTKNTRFDVQEKAQEWLNAH